ncbi:hypothetical protein JXA88_02335 [Candidatus Fermentibacteria bacterium]|nr:hypothetical protein [Candidatus Fermentibacteria bacterium]
MKAVALLVSGTAALLWLLPTPGERAVASVGMLVVLAWAFRMSGGVGRFALIVLCGGIIAGVPNCPSLVIPRALAIAAMAVSAKGWGIVALLGGGGWYLVDGRLEPAAVFATLALLVRPNLDLRPRILGGAAVCGMLAYAASSILSSGDALGRWDSGTLRRYAWAAVLNARNPQAIIRTSYAAVLGGDSRGASEALEDLASLERRTGTTPASLALRIAASAVAGTDARALLAEAVYRRPAALDSLAAWNDASLPWRELAASLHTGRPPLHEVSWPTAAVMSRDSLAAEYAARLLLDAGLDAQACTLASLRPWRQRGWSRYVVWKARQAWEEPRNGLAVGRLPQPLAPGAWLLTRGQPARGVWPVYRLDDGVVAEETPAWSEEWILTPRHVQSTCSVTLVNDLRAPGEDRNAFISIVEGVDEIGYVDPPSDMEGFRQRLAARLMVWSDGRGRDPLAENVLETWSEVQTVAMDAAVPEKRGVMLPAEGSVQWRLQGEGSALLVVRGQPAVGRWPIVELSWNGTIRRHAVDAEGWTCLPLELSSSGVLSARFVNDFWDPATGQDRNLWIAGLFAHPSQARDHARQ